MILVKVDQAGLANTYRGVVCVCVFVCMRLQGLDHTHHRVCFTNSLLLPRPQVPPTMRPKRWPRPTVTSCPHTHTHNPSSVDTSGGDNKPVHCGWLCSTTGPLWSLSHQAKLQISHSPLGQDVHGMLSSTKWAKFRIQATVGSPRLWGERDLASAVGKHNSGFAVAQAPPWHKVWHLQTPHAEGTPMITPTDLCVRYGVRHHDWTRLSSVSNSRKINSIHTHVNEAHAILSQTAFYMF